MRRFIIFFLLTVTADQLTKFLSTFLGQQGYINPGISFSLLSNETQVAIIIFTVVVIVLLALGYGYFWAKHPIVAGLFFGGAFSNLIDRLFVGGVRDWIALPVVNLQNNLADIAIVGSLLVVIWYVWKGAENE